MFVCSFGLWRWWWRRIDTPACCRADANASAVARTARAYAASSDTASANTASATAASTRAASAAAARAAATNEHCNRSALDQRNLCCRCRSLHRNI
jgi:hypothetical protein